MHLQIGVSNFYKMNYFLCPDANGLADLLPKTFLAWPGGIGLASACLGCLGGFGGLGGLGGAPQDTRPILNVTVAK